MKHHSKIWTEIGNHNHPLQSLNLNKTKSDHNQHKNQSKNHHSDAENTSGANNVEKKNRSAANNDGLVEREIDQERASPEKMDQIWKQRKRANQETSEEHKQCETGSDDDEPDRSEAKEEKDHAENVNEAGEEP